MIILKRNEELKKVKLAGPWIYICGRRKTGKTFFVKNFLKWDEYFFVKRDGSIFDKDGKRIAYETFFTLFKEIIGKKKIVIDEFHRLPNEFLDYLHFLGTKGELIVISSTLWFSKKLLGSGSPLLGLFSLIIFGLVDERDVLLSLERNEYSRRYSRDDIIEASVYLREPILAKVFRFPLRKCLASFLNENKLSLREIIGEIFEEEERKLSEIYEGIMRAVASGKNVSTEISSYLFSRGLIQKDNPGYIQRYLDNLVKMGILERLEVWNKNKFRYFHISPIFDLHFYLDEKYGYTEVEIPNKFVERVVEVKLPFHIEQFFGNLLSKLFGLKRVLVEEPEVDIVLTEYKRLRVVCEVKWKKRVGVKEVKEIERKLGNFKDAKRYLIVPERCRLEKKPKNIEILNSKRILEMIKRSGVK